MPVVNEVESNKTTQIDDHIWFKKAETTNFIADVQK